VQDAYANRAKVVIPSFAVGRTQELLYILGEMMHRDEIPAITIFLDSPMAIAATEVHENHPEVFDKETLERIRKGDNPFHPVSLTFSRTVQESRKINFHDGAAVIIAGGGMCEGGRIVHHLKHNVYKEQNYLVFVGYQAEGTLGRVILNGKKKLRLLGEEVMVNAKIVTIDSFSAHADQNGLIDWLENFEKSPQAVFLVHGEEKAGQDFGEVVREKLGFLAYQPRLNQQVDLARLEDVAVDKRRFIERRPPSAQEVSEIVAKVIMQGEEFRDSIEHYLSILGERIRKSKEEGLEPHWRTEDVKELLEHLSSLIGCDVDQMKEVMGTDTGA
jgi:metallo-beta-lactamase family protein